MTSRDGILALVSDPDVSHTAWRVTRPYQRLREVGVDAQILTLGPPGTDGITWNPQIAGIPIPEGVGTLVLPRATVPPNYRLSFLAWLEKLRGRGVTVVYETDDDTFSSAWIEHHVAARKDRAALGAGFLQGMRQQLRRQCEEDRWILEHVDGITVSTHHLAGVIRACTHRPVMVVPNALDVEAFRSGLVPEPAWRHFTTIGWAGGYRPEADAAPVAEAWTRIAARYHDVGFVVAGWQPSCLTKAVPAERLFRVPYADMASYPAGMQATIGCCGAADTVFNRSRGPGKAWEFALAGAAVVASPSVYRGAVDGVVNGYLATTADEWETALADLLEDRHERDLLALNLREEVVREHALASNLWRWQDAYRTVRAAGKPDAMALALTGAYDG